jgi:hypothetical protein
MVAGSARKVIVGAGGGGVGGVGAVDAAGGGGGGACLHADAKTMLTSRRIQPELLMRDTVIT